MENGENTSLHFLTTNKILAMSFVDILNPCPHNDIFLTPLGNKPFENTVGKGEIARNEQFLLYP